VTMTASQFTTVATADLAVVTAAAAGFAHVARRVGQPAGVGQILAGVLLGPTLLGRLSPAATAWMFPPEILPFLQTLGQIAVILFMFSVGYELRVTRNVSRAVPLISVLALALPMALGSGIGVLFAGRFTAAGEDVAGSGVFVVYLGVATGISALPVMAAIIRDRGLAGTRPATLAVASAGLMDFGAWIVLAGVLIAAGSRNQQPPLATAGLFAALIVLLFGLVRPALRWWLEHTGPLHHLQMPVALVLAAGTASATSSLGLDAVLGGLLAGLVMPVVDGVPDTEVVRGTELVGNLLLPMFFTVTGLSLSLGTFHGGDMLLLALVCLAAFAGKLGGGYGAGRLLRLSRPDSAVLATLLNSRGLTELVVLGIGLRAGIIHQRLFGVMVLMALISTVMTAPLLARLAPHTDAVPDQAADALPARTQTQAVIAD
jgi:Kef-type K+ transport system membrane component KefB